ncbi:tyrosine-type recombinase/integrase [Bacillus sp. ISL-35]|uniref:tyrosine-type recombinase/integrase n=1 Tax=Bacillus sp. ISL-35 TaxID=2819122 RepID=UPI001BE8F78C|nr:tyrosine-type recombinase/integrase [Bacillus sp. ISL-35]MBT2681807.1 tyrosine-type recombinase/integrase [Bacillus sp. ISL-35]
MKGGKELSRKNIDNYFQHSLHDQIRKELSTYMERTIEIDGSVTYKVVNDPYFLVNDHWDIRFIGNINNFKDQLENYYYRKNIIRFEIENPRVNLELKYLWYKRLFKDEWSLSTIYGVGATKLYKLTSFLNEKFPHIDSILNIDFNKANLMWLSWLNDNGSILTRQASNKNGGYTSQTPIAGFFGLIYKYLCKYSDLRAEWEKDRWDIRKLNDLYGINYVKSTSAHYIDFSKIMSNQLTKIVKQNIKRRLYDNYAWASAIGYVRQVTKFINYILAAEPSWTSFKYLERKHIEKYLDWLKNETRKDKKITHFEHHINTNLHYITQFLEDISTYNQADCPLKPVSLLVFPEDRPSLKKKPIDQVDYIPDYVLEQLFRHINLLNKDAQPVVWVAFKTGLRISDVLGLTQDCLIKLNGKYYIETDIEKTNVIGHRIPIDDELADILAVIINNSILHSNKDNNPEKLLFVRYRGTRKGRPYEQQWIGVKLNELAKLKNITDENGDLFHFKTHQFRHTYAVKMINNGVDIITLQDLLAHASPEMTMRYAKLLDNTKRKVFEEALRQGVFSFDLNGEVQEIKSNQDIPTGIFETLWRDHKLNAIDNPYGTCHARINGNCPYAEEPPCLTCNSGSPCKDLAIGFSDLDTQKYELLIKATAKTIAALEHRGRNDIVEKNRKNLQRYQGILETIKDGNIIFGRVDRFKRKHGANNE